MTYDFFAAAEDKIELLNYILAETDLHIYGLNSNYGQNIREYKSLADITSWHNLNDESGSDLQFQLWSPQFKGRVDFRKIELNPQKCNGHTFRYVTEGWGLIQLYLHGIEGNRLKPSHIGHYNRAGALKWEVANKDKGPVDSWDWKEIQKISNQLKYLLHKKISVKTIGTYGVLPGAQKLEAKGVLLL